MRTPFVIATSSSFERSRMLVSSAQILELPSFKQQFEGYDTSRIHEYGFVAQLEAVAPFVIVDKVGDHRCRGHKKVRVIHSLSCSTP